MLIPDLSIVIVSYNTKEILHNCLKSIYDTIGNLSHEIFVVDNASRDGSPDFIEKEFKSITLIRNNENLGFARANNQAIRLAKGRCVLLLNSDTILKAGAAETLVRFIEKHPDAAAVGPKVLSADESLQNKGFFFPSILYSLLVLAGINKFMDERIKRRIFPKFYWDENDIREVDYLEGSCLLVKREAFNTIGLLPEVYFLYFEETEWCFRAKKLRYRIWYVPAAEIIHLHSSSPLDEKNEIFTRSLLLFYKRNIGIIKGSIIAVLMISASFVDFILGLLLKSDEAKLRKIKRQLQQQTTLLKGLFGPDRISDMRA